jgi:hypothetical protein
MNLPRSIFQPLSVRAGVTIVVALYAASLSVAAQPGAQLTCTPSNLRFGTVQTTQTETQLMTLTNSGQNSVTVSSMNLSGAEFSVTGLSLPATLTAGQSVTFNVVFSPTSVGWMGGQATFNSNASNSSLLLSLAGTGVASDLLSASPSSLSFNPVTIGSSSTQSVVLINNRSTKTTITAFQTSGTEFTVSVPNAPLTLNPGQTVTLKVTFTPQVAGLTSGSIFVLGPRLNVPFIGTGGAAASGQLSITPPLVNFGNVPVGTTGTQPITMSATGAAVTVSSDASSNALFVLDGASFPLTIPAGQSVTFNVAFSPKNSGTASGSLSFASNASDSQATESLSGTGTVTAYSVNLWWNPSNDVTGYNVYRSVSANGSYARINAALDANTAYTDNSVTSGQTYYYEATSVNSAGLESARSTPPVVAAVP